MLRNLARLDKKNNSVRLFYLRENSHKGINVKVAHANLDEIKKRPERGESILITQRSTQNSEAHFVSHHNIRDYTKKQAAELWYFTHQ